MKKATTKHGIINKKPTTHGYVFHMAGIKKLDVRIFLYGLSQPSEGCTK